ncbi:MAG: HAMP domain-containing histidine kinase [Ktedonobacteraceae bacterium]|nr:HAMP domain-containing histidine kinase [Ktedonobacteraceae bacterium]
MPRVSETHAQMLITEALGPGYLQKLSWQNTVGVIGALFLVAASIVGTGLLSGRLSIVFSDTLSLLAALVGACWAWSTTYRARCGPLQLSPRYQLAWLLIGLALMAQGLARVYVMVFHVRGLSFPVPSYADLGFTCFYPLIFAGLILTLTGPRLERACTRMGPDAAITTLCVLAVSWSAFIAPSIQMQKATHVSTDTLITTLSYPFWDVLLILATLMIIRRCAERILHSSLLLCALGLIAAIFADTITVYATLLGLAHSDLVFLSPLRPISALLIGLSSRYQYAALASSAYHEQAYSTATSNEDVPHDTSPRRFVLLQSVLLYLPLMIVSLLTLASALQHDEARVLFLIVLTTLVALFIAARYLLATYENELLLHDRERRRRDVEQLQTTYQELQELDQLKDQFLTTASHELRTPLTCVQGYLELLTLHDEALSPKERQDFLHKAQYGCEELVTLLNTMMNAGRLEIEEKHPAHLERVCVHEIIQYVLTLIEPQLTQEQREVQVHVPAHLAVQADVERLRQVLLNISVNALKYSPAGSPLAFSAQLCADCPTKVVIGITDKGKGIAPEDQAHVFQRFVRLERDMNSPVRGSGLGLYICRCLMEAMGGTIWIESTGVAGEGTTLRVRLPRA